MTVLFLFSFFVFLARQNNLEDALIAKTNTFKMIWSHTVAQDQILLQFLL